MSLQKWQEWPLSILAACLTLAVGVAIPALPEPAEVFVIERDGARVKYSLHGKPGDTTQPMTGIRKALGDARLEQGVRLFVLVGEGVAIDEPYLIGSVLGKIGGFKEVRYFHFSRRSGVMMEFSLDAERWKLSFDGTLVR